VTTNSRFPWPTSDEIPPGLRSLIALLIRAQEQQREYAKTPIAQTFWPDARIQYVSQPFLGLSVGGAVRQSGEKPDIRLGVGGKISF
jgi:hypothetical protein